MNSTLNLEMLTGKSIFFIFGLDVDKQEYAKIILRCLYPEITHEAIKDLISNNYSFGIDKKGNLKFYSDLYYTNWWGRSYAELVSINEDVITLTRISRLKPIKPFPHWYIFE